jgi:hypothetical protein
MIGRQSVKQRHTAALCYVQFNPFTLIQIAQMQAPEEACGHRLPAIRSLTSEADV